MLSCVDLTLDCSHPDVLAEFWKAAAGYVDEQPPAPFRTRAEWLARFDEDEDDGRGRRGCMIPPAPAAAPIARESNAHRAAAARSLRRQCGTAPSSPMASFVNLAQGPGLDLNSCETPGPAR